MTAEYLGVGIVGPGWVAGEHINAFGRNPHTRVVAICGRTEETARRLKEAKGLEDCQIYSDYEKMLEQADLDIVSICTPNDLHAEEGILAAKAGKHMLIEKPAATTLESLHALEEAVTEAKVKALVGFELRWSPLLEVIKSLLAADAIGSVFYSELDYRSGMLAGWYPGFDWSRKIETGGSSFLVAGCHAIDAMRWLVGSEAVEVTAYSGGWDRRYEYDATIVAIIKFENGAVGKSLSSIELNMPYGFNIELYGDKGTIINRNLYSLSLMKGQTDFAEIPCIGPETSDVRYHPFQPEMDHLVDCILNDKEPLVNMADAVKTHEICIAADISAAENRPVKLPLK
jgi:predicted dehydrogenase